MSGCAAHAKTEVEVMWTNQHGTGPKTDDRLFGWLVELLIDSLTD